MHYIMKKNVLNLARKAYETPGCEAISISMECVVCNPSGTGREDIGGLGDRPGWDPED